MIQLLMGLSLFLVAVAAKAATPDGASLFTQNCAPCHQADASGTVGLAPPLKGEQWVKLGAERSYVLTVLINGLSGPIAVNGQRFSGSMPAFGPRLDDAVIASIATYLRSLQGTSVTYTDADVKAVRETPGSPPQTRALRTQIVGPG
jgi:mono/diheme cytochrome c family protein